MIGMKGEKPNLESHAVSEMSGPSDARTLVSTSSIHIDSSTAEVPGSGLGSNANTIRKDRYLSRLWMGLCAICSNG